MDRENNSDKSFGSAAWPASETDGAAEAAPKIGPHNPALGEIYQRLYPEMRRPKPNQEAIAAALQAMQRLTMEADSETVVEQTMAEDSVRRACRVCGHQNREGNKFCGGCGLALGIEFPGLQEAITVDGANDGANDRANDRTSGKASLSDPAPLAQTAHGALEVGPEVHPAAGAVPGTHYYHHHYHHHYFQGGLGEAAAVMPRPNAPESAREADRMRVAAAARGEPMSRNEAAVRRLTQEWVLACNTRQLDELIDLYAADALVLRSNLPPIRGAMAVREFFHASLEAGLGEVAVEPMRVEVSGDLAHEVGRYSALVPGIAGKRREERGKYLWVFAKQASGDWKLVSECWSSDLMLTGAEADLPKTAAPPGKRKS